MPATLPTPVGQMLSNPNYFAGGVLTSIFPSQERKNVDYVEVNQISPTIARSQKPRMARPKALLRR
jgi:hypothetical protein